MNEEEQIAANEGCCWNEYQEFCVGRGCACSCHARGVVKKKPERSRAEEIAALEAILKAQIGEPEETEDDVKLIESPAALEFVDEPEGFEYVKDLVILQPPINLIAQEVTQEIEEQAWAMVESRIRGQVSESDMVSLKREWDAQNYPAVETTYSATCAHCGNPVNFSQHPSEKNWLLLEHVDAIGGVHHTTAVVKTHDGGKMTVELGRWLRRIVHPEPVVREATPLAMEPPKEPVYAAADTDRHLLEVIRPLLGPRLEEISTILHLTGAVGPMKEMMLDAREDCGFVSEIVLRVRTGCSCFATRGRSSDDLPGQEGDASTSNNSPSCNRT